MNNALNYQYSKTVFNNNEQDESIDLAILEQARSLAYFLACNHHFIGNKEMNSLISSIYEFLHGSKNGERNEKQ